MLIFKLKNKSFADKDNFILVWNKEIGLILLFLNFGHFMDWLELEYVCGSKMLVCNPDWWLELKEMELAGTCNIGYWYAKWVRKLP